MEKYKTTCRPFNWHQPRTAKAKRKKTGDPQKDSRWRAERLAVLSLGRMNLTDNPLSAGVSRKADPKGRPRKVPYPSSPSRARQRLGLYWISLGLMHFTAKNPKTQGRMAA